MAKVKVGATVQYKNNPNDSFTVLEKIKGAKTNRPVFHGGILFNGYQSKPKKFKLSNGDIVSPNQLKVIQ